MYRGRDWRVGSTGVSLDIDNGTLMHIRDFSELNSYCCLQRRGRANSSPFSPIEMAGLCMRVGGMYVLCLFKYIPLSPS